MKDVVAARLRAQRLVGAPFEDPAGAVRWFGAVQAQDYAGAKWALGMRVKDATDSAIDRLFDAGEILRTHVLRPTWHFVLPEDIRWLLALTGPKVRRSLAGRYRQLELDAETHARAGHAFAGALAGRRHLTRVELGRVLSDAGILFDEHRLPHLIMGAELDGLIVSGPRVGKQMSFALLEERVRQAPVLDRDEALGELARRYFTSHGPAQLRDLVWWSRLTLADVRRGIQIAGPALAHGVFGGADYWFDAALAPGRPGPPWAHLLPNFDEYIVGYTDRAAVLHPERPFRPELFAFSSMLSNVVLVGGQIAGAWKRVSGGNGVWVEVRQLEPMAHEERRLVDGAARRLSGFLGRPVAVSYQDG